MSSARTSRFKVQYTVHLATEVQYFPVVLRNTTVRRRCHRARLFPPGFFSNFKLRPDATRLRKVMLFFLTLAALALDNGLGRTPARGWNAWNSIRCEGLNEKLIREVADAMVSSGLRDAGYTYVNIDDCWMVRTWHSPCSRTRRVPCRSPSPLPLRISAHSAHRKLCTRCAHGVRSACAEHTQCTRSATRVTRTLGKMSQDTGSAHAAHAPCTRIARAVHVYYCTCRRRSAARTATSGRTSSASRQE